MNTDWLYARDVAKDLDVTTETARKLLRRIPGAEVMYRFDGRRGERRRVSRAAYDAWRAAQRKPA